MSSKMNSRIQTKTKNPFFKKIYSQAFILAVIVFSSAVQSNSVSDSVLLANDSDGTNWPGYGRTYSEQHYSPLDQINRDTINDLGLAWSLDLDEWNVSSEPLAVDGVIYIAVGFSIVHAVNAVTGERLWTYDTQVSSHNQRYAWGIRGLAYWNKKIYVGTQDGRLVAIDANDGSLVWQTRTTEKGSVRSITGAPRVFNGKVIIGHGGADFGPVRGYVTTYDAETGEQIWRWFTVPGNPADGFENKAMEMAAETWTGEWWKNGGGGTAWNAMTYDPKFNRVYIGTGNGTPWNQKLRSPGGGDNLFLCSIVALDADTGEYIWHYQTTPGESWDFNSTMDITLADLHIHEESRPVILHAPKNGFFYVIDRTDGELISAEKLGKVTWADRVDMATGRPVENPGVRYEGNTAVIWPGSLGLHNWHPMAFSPESGLTYVPARELPGVYNDEGITPENFDLSKRGGSGNNFSVMSDVPEVAGTSSIIAWDPIKKKKIWEQETPGVTNGGLLATAGGLVFQGQADGQFVARDATNGSVLFSTFMGVGTQAAPISFSVNGRQYISLLAGWGGSAGVLGTMNAQFGWVGRTYPRRLLTYALDGSAELPQSPAPAKPEPIHDPDFKIDPELADLGKYVYGRNCTLCHGVAVVAGAYAPDLRASPLPLSNAAFKAVVQGGSLESRGMPKFDDLSDEEILALQHFIRWSVEYKPSIWSKIQMALDFVGPWIKMTVSRWFSSIGDDS